MRLTTVDKFNSQLQVRLCRPKSVGVFVSINQLQQAAVNWDSEITFGCSGSLPWFSVSWDAMY